jgi:hypothetical protein
MFSLQQKLENKRAEQALPGGEGCSGEVAQTTYTHVSKCKSDKIKQKKNTKNKFGLNCNYKLYVNIYLCAF